METVASMTAPPPDDVGEARRIALHDCFGCADLLAIIERVCGERDAMWVKLLRHHEAKTAEEWGEPCVICAKATTSG